MEGDATGIAHLMLGVAHAHGQLTRGGGGHHDGDQGEGQVYDRVWDGGVAEEGHRRGGGALAKVKDGYGGARPRRSYWKRKTMVPDGLVQKRILQFTGIVGQNSGGGGISVFGGQPGNGKRKWDGL